MINNVQTVPNVIGGPNANNVIIQSNAPKAGNENIVSKIPSATNIQKVVNMVNNPNININQVSDDRGVNPIYKTMNLQESKLSMNNLNNNNNINYKKDIANNTVNIIDLRKGMENNSNTINPRYNIKTINNTLNDLRIKNNIELRNTRLSKSPVNDYRSVNKSPVPSSRGFHKVRIMKKSPDRNRGNFNSGMNYNYNYDYLTYNYQNKNKNIYPYPNNINNINAKSNNVFNKDKLVNSKNERKNSNSFVKVKKIDRIMNNKGNTNANSNEFNSNTYNIKSNYNGNYGKKYENDCMLLKKVNQQDKDSSFRRKLAVGMLIYSCVFLCMIVWIPIPESQNRYVDYILGFLTGTVVTTVINYFYGNSSKTEKQDASISDETETKNNDQS